MTVSDVMGLPAKSYGSSNTLSTELTVIDIEEEEEEKLPQEPVKTLLSGLFLLSGFLATTLSLALTHDRVPTNTSSLPDLVLDNVTYQQFGLDISEILLVLNLVLALGVVLCQTYRLIIFRRVWLVLGIIYYYRALTMSVTVLPKPDMRYECRPRVEHVTGFIIVERVLTILSGGGLSINGKHVLCGDYIFSGHTSTLLLSYLVVRQCNSPSLSSPSVAQPSFSSDCSSRALHLASLLLSVLGVTFLLLGRGHYTIDVVVAYYITTRLWWAYHLLAENKILQTASDHNYLRHEAWWTAARSISKKNIC